MSEVKRDINEYLQYFRKDAENIYIREDFIDRLAELKGKSLQQLMQIVFADQTDDVRTLRKIQAAFERGKSIENRRNQKRYRKQKISSNIRWTVWERDNFTCQICGARKFLAVDHIYPESKGGTLELSNLQTLCKHCNSSKGAK